MNNTDKPTEAKEMNEALGDGEARRASDAVRREVTEDNAPNPPNAGAVEVAEESEKGKEAEETEKVEVAEESEKVEVAEESEKVEAAEASEKAGKADKAEHADKDGKNDKDGKKEPASGKRIVKRVFSILGNVLLYLFLAICIFAVVLTISSRKDTDGTAEIFGYQFRVVVSESMAKCEQTDVSQYEIGSIPLKSLVFVQTVPDDPTEAAEWYASLQVGDVLTFRYQRPDSNAQEVVTHRIISIEPKTGGYLIKLQGDNKGDAEYGEGTTVMTQVIDTSLSQSYTYVIGKVVGQNYLLGLLLSILKTPVGIVLVIIVPCFIIILLEVLKIAGAISADKKKREQEKQEEKDSEIEELRRRLAALEQGGAAAGGRTSAPETSAAPPKAETAAASERIDAPNESNDFNDSEESDVSEQNGEKEERTKE